MKVAPRSVLAAAALALAGCDLTLPWSSSDPGERLEVSPSRLEFVVNKGDPVPAAREVRIRVKTDLWIYPGDGTTVPLATHLLGEGPAEVRAQQLAFSGDGLRIIGLTDAPAVRIVTAP